MTFMQEIYQFKKIFRDIEKATKKCVVLNGANEYKISMIPQYLFVIIKNIV